MSTTNYSAIWTTTPGVTCRVIDEGRLVHIIAERGDGEDKTEVFRVTIDLPNRRAAIGEAVLPRGDRAALKMGRALFAIAEQMGALVRRRGEDMSRFETLRCPYCGHEVTREEHPSALHCGPHVAADGYASPARRMLVVRAAGESDE